MKGKPHTILGLIVLSLVLFVTFSGVGSAMLGRFYHGKPWSHHKEVHTKIGSFHKFLGYLILMLGLLATSTGIGSYQLIYYS